MFEYLKNGGSLNRIIEKIIQNENNKQSLGIIGCLTNGLYSRVEVDSEVGVSSLILFVYRKQRDKLNQYIKKIGR